MATAIIYISDTPNDAKKGGPELKIKLNLGDRYSKISSPEDMTQAQLIASAAFKAITTDLEKVKEDDKD